MFWGQTTRTVSPLFTQKCTQTHAAALTLTGAFFARLFVAETVLFNRNDFGACIKKNGINAAVLCMREYYQSCHRNHFTISSFLMVTIFSCQKCLVVGRLRLPSVASGKGNTLSLVCAIRMLFIGLKNDSKFRWRNRRRGDH